MISAVNAFKGKLSVWNMHFKSGRLTHVRRFGELDIMEDIAALISNPFLTIDIGEVVAKFQQVFAFPSGVDMEMVDLQNDIELKHCVIGSILLTCDSDFWGLVSGNLFTSSDLFITAPM